MNNPIFIRLTEAEIMTAAIEGVKRQNHVIQGHLQGDKNEPKNNCWHRHIEGCLSESALAKHFGVYWQGKGNPGDEDFAGGIEARSADSDYKRLILQPKDKDDSKFYFLTGQYGTYKLRGWIMGIDGKQPEYWDQPKGAWQPAYFVPTDKLSPIEDTM